MVEVLKKRPLAALGAVVVAAFGLGYVGWSLLSQEGADAGPSHQESMESKWTEAEAQAEPPEGTTESPAEEKPSEPEPSAQPSADEEKESAELAESDGSKVAEREEGEIDRPVDAEPEELFPGQTRKKQERKEYKPAVLEIVTNFDKADVTVNGLPYPEYASNDAEEPGMVLPAGGPYTIKVTYDGKEKTYTLSLDPYEVRVMMVELTGFEGGAPSKSADRRHKKKEDSSRGISNNQQQGNGRVTVYSKPKGTIQVDGSARDQKTPGTIEVEAGQHDVQVEFDDGNMSESKTVRVREGSRIKLFFRKRD